MTDKKTIEHLCKKGVFEHYISLGRGCYIAIELEQMGLRDASMPFDWNGTRWHAIEKAIKNKFDGYLSYKDLYQKKAAPHIYKNIDYGVAFMHDFVSYLPLIVQFGKVRKKYQRRINKFYSYINSPCLFFRYCWDLEEVEYIAQNYSNIEDMVKKWNGLSEIVFITHEKVEETTAKRIKNLYYVDIDLGEELNKNPITSNQELFEILNNAKCQKREDNLCFYREKELKKKTPTFFKKMKRRGIKLLSSYTYTHNKQY